MKSNLFTVMKKEFARFFKDPRMVFTTILMPGLLIYVMYSFMGNGFSEMASEDEEEYRICTVNLPQSLKVFQGAEGFDIREIGEDETETVKEEITEGTGADLLVVFPEDFEEAAAAYDVAQTTEPAPNIDIFYNSSETGSYGAYQAMTATLDAVEDAMANKFDVNASDADYELGSEKDMTAMVFAMVLPMLIMVFLFSGCMAITSESIAGEKERGTIATLLVTPLKRRELALGKLLSLSAIGLLSGCSSFLGTLLSLPKLIGFDMDVSIRYSAVDYLWLLVVILSTTIVIVGAISVISTFAKTVKEAGTMVVPLMLLVLLVSIAPMLGGGATGEWYWYLVPIYNSVQCMTGLFSMDYSIVSIAVTAFANIVCAGLLVMLLTKMFGSERIMYNQ